ncbi:DNA N-6-adenine-methyltransferase [Fusobacterium varium]|uniref:DNA N-6-adenine-methyltransferase n=1 Tax=Fusobacterium varium TaxID=856 RepID=UPI00241D2940|nr:DNA N-6-adenine-methyltransferase [Fusobacterium varium]
MNTELMFNSEKMDWTTPKEFFKQLDDEFHFTLDPASTHENALCEKHYTTEEDGLKQDWEGEIVYCNPPYGREVKYWVKKCYEESLKPNTTVVLLIFARTDTKYFYDYIYKKAELRFIKGRLKFGNCKNSAPFPSMVVIFRR